MTMNFMFAFTTLINQGELEKGTNIGAFASKSDENRDIRGMVFRVFAIWVEINCPLITTNSESLASYVFPYTNSFG